MEEFEQKQTDYADEGNRFNNGNGSIMRIAPIAICYSNDEKKAMKYAERSSLTTHNGDEAK